MPETTPPEQMSLLSDEESETTTTETEEPKSAHKAGDVVDGVTLSEANAAALNGDKKKPEDDGLDKRPDWWKGDPTVAVFKNEEALAKGFKDLKSLLGKKGAVAPDSYDESVLPPSFKLSDEYKAQLKGATITNEQLKVVGGIHAKEMQRVAVEHQKLQLKLEEMTLKAEWGPQFQTRFAAAAEFAVKKYGKDGAKKLFSTAQGVKDAEIESKAFGNGRSMDDDTIGGSGNSTVTQADAIAYRNKFTDSEFRNNPGAQKKYSEMTSQIAQQRNRKAA